MRANGTLQYEIIQDGGVNTFGEPLDSVATWSEPIRCSVNANSDNRRGIYEDGTFRQATWVVLIERNAHRDINVINDIKRVKLARGNESLGEYFVMSVTPLDTVGRVKIIV